MCGDVGQKLPGDGLELCGMDRLHPRVDQAFGPRQHVKQIRSERGPL